MLFLLTDYNASKQLHLIPISSELPLLNIHSLNYKIMRRLVSLSFCLIIAFMAQAADFTFNGLNYSTNNDGTVSVGRQSESLSGNIVIPSTVTFNGKSYAVKTIEEGAFGATKIVSMKISSGVKTIGEGAFGACTALKSIIIPAGVTSMGEGAFGACTSLTSVTIPGSCTSIVEGTFGACVSLKTVIFSEGVKKIGEGAFGACVSLMSVTLPKSMAEVGEGAFGACASIASLTISSSETKIGEGAFGACNNLKEIRFLCKEPPVYSTDDDSFAGIDKDGIKVIVPKGTKGKYASSGWNCFTNIVE